METKPDDAVSAAGFSSAADALAWLVAMGADEIILETPVNRFAESAKAEKAKSAPAPALVAAPPPPRPTQRAVAITAATAPEQCNSLADLRQALNFFESHPLRKSATQLSFFEGPETAQILILSDRPRNEEDKSGLVFAGKARVLLTNMLKAIQLNLEDVALMNLIPWRPPGNRHPTEAEIGAVLPFARRALEILKPRLILSFGALPGQHLAGGDASILRQRGKWHALGETALMSTLHPDDLLKHPLQKKMAWRDLLLFSERLP